MLLAIANNSVDGSEAFLFYINQYTFTSITTFIIILALDYVRASYLRYEFIENNFIDNYAGIFKINPILTLSFAVCLFSIAGIPPLIGFFGKMAVLYSAIHSGYYFIAIIAIILSVISASYYLYIIRVIHFNTSNFIDYKMYNNSFKNPIKNPINNLHSYFISLFTLILIIYLIHPHLLLNSVRLLAITQFNT
jgi:NADH-ubiquinone oxidoreductase chain 2